MILYRGVNQEIFEQFDGALIPKESKPFVKSPEWDRAEWGNSYWGECKANAVVEHQQHQAGYPTSGISTTPHLERAIYYATYDGKFSCGYVYVIDETKCQTHKVSVYIVKDIVPMPSVPEDNEVVLVASDFGELPRSLIIEIKKVSA